MSVRVILAAAVAILAIGDSAIGQTVRGPIANQTQVPRVSVAPANGDLAALQQRVQRLEAELAASQNRLNQLKAAVYAYAFCEQQALVGGSGVEGSLHCPTDSNSEVTRLTLLALAMAH